MNFDSGSILSQVALVVALLLFVGIIAWLWFTPGARWKRNAGIPLDEGTLAPTRGHRDGAGPGDAARDRSESKERRTP